MFAQISSTAQLLEIEYLSNYFTISKSAISSVILSENSLAFKSTYSPLRYPGGKSSLSHYLTRLAIINDVVGGHYIEMFAGGSGAALNLLFNNVFKTIQINDFDSKIYKMWVSILNETDKFIGLVESTDVNMHQWHCQQTIYNNEFDYSDLEVGFAVFYLNRTNRSGIIHKAGPIGGMHQTGKYRIDVRFNKKELIRRIDKIARYKESIEVTNTDASKLTNSLNTGSPDVDLFVYLDPPYYKKGKYLYLNNFNHSDHIRLFESISKIGTNFKWLISYDNTPEIVNIYKNYRMASFGLNYSLQEKRQGNELLIFSPSMILEPRIKIKNRYQNIEFI